MKRGFTLVELAVVMIIIGLLIGGLIAGRSMIESSKIQAATADLGKYKEAAQNFKEKYRYFPGDQPDATQIWSTAPSDGDGDGRIGQIAGHGGQINITNDESLYAPVLLSLSGFITGSYTYDGGFVPNKNLPASPLSGVSNANLSSPVYVYGYMGLGGVEKNAVIITDIDTSARAAGAMTPLQALSIDQKIDDGIAISGIVRGIGNPDTNTACLTSGSTNYNSTSDVLNAELSVGSASDIKCIISYLVDQ